MIVIPARLQSTRLAKKALVDIAGEPMVIRVAKIAKKIDKCVVATDSEEIIEVCGAYGIEAVMTDKNHKSGTDRVNEAAHILGLKDEEIVINLQGDEPLMEPKILASLEERIKLALQNGENIIAASCYKKITAQEATDPAKVKVVTDANGYAMYFSRSMLPYDRDGEGVEHFLHLGLYGFTKASLERFCTLPHFYLEDVEKLEQLRALGNGQKIAMIEVETRSFGIDTEADLLKVREVFNRGR